MAEQTTGQIGFDQLGIASVLNRYALRVPVNQREYSWEDRHVRALFQDLAKAISENASEYFLGTIVGIPEKADTLEIVDGQQRLATTAILLAAIRDYLHTRPEDKLLVEFVENDFLTKIDPEARERVSRLRLNTLDSVYFDRRVLNSDEIAEIKALSHRRINDAALLARDHIKAIIEPHNEKNHADVLNTWIRFVQLKAVVMLLRVPSEVNAYRMFETLNDRGLKTSQADLVKNYLFGQSADRVDEAQQHWASMRTLLESLDDEDITITFLRQMLISHFGHLRDPEIYEKVQANAKGVTSALGLLAKLAANASDYVAMLNPEHEKWNGYPATARQAIRTLIHLRLKAIRPLVLSIMRRFDPAEADKALRLIVDLSVRYLIAGGGRTGTAEEGLAEAAVNVSDKKIANAKELHAALAKIAPTDKTFEDAFKIATVTQAHLARYYLRALELKQTGGAEPCFIPNDNEQVINLEHVLPKSPEGNWPEFKGDDVAKAYVKRIGNMALMQATPNSDLKSELYAKKKRLYAASPFALTKQVAEAAKWDPAAIEARQTKLAALAVKTWPLKVK